MPPRISQVDLVSGILTLLDKLGVKNVSSRQINAVIKAADEIKEAIETPDRLATPNMGLAAWLNSDDTGQSSLYMARAIVPFTTLAVYVSRSTSTEPWPHDPDDFGRCVRLLDAAPELRPHILKLNTPDHPPVWNIIAYEWNTLEAWYREDLPTGKSQRLYKRLREIAEACR